MFSPKMEARLLQEVAPRPHEMVLEIGTGSGYMAALLAAHADSVASWELRADLVDLARRQLHENGVLNVAVMAGDGLAAAVAGGHTYDVIVLSGAVEVLPQARYQLNHLAHTQAAQVIAHLLLTVTPHVGIHRTERLNDHQLAPGIGLVAKNKLGKGIHNGHFSHRAIHILIVFVLHFSPPMPLDTSG